MNPRLVLPAALALAVAIAGCSRDADNAIPVSGPKDLVGRKCAVVVGSMMGDMTLEVQPGIEVEWFNDYNSGVEAVRLGKVAAMPLDYFYARRWARQDPDAFAITEPYHSIPWGFFFAKGSPLKDKVNAVLSKMEDSGDLARILAKWSEAENPGALRLEDLSYRPDFTGKAGTLRFATPGDREPVSFVTSDGFVGFDIDLVRRIAYELDMSLELVQISMGALVPAVQGGKADMGGGGIAITAERAEKVDFSSCYYRVPTVFLISRSSAAEKDIRTIRDLKGRLCGTIIGSAMGEIVERIQPGVEFCVFNDYPSAVEALRLGKIDAVPLDRAVLRRWVANRPGEFRLGESFGENPYGYFFTKGSPLTARVNEILARMTVSGDLKRIISKWCDSSDPDAVRPEPYPHRADFTGRNGRFRFVTSGDYEPGTFIRNGVAVGFDIDIAKWIADELDMNFEDFQVTAAALVPAVQGGKAEMGGGCVTITESRREKVDFSDCYLNDGFALMLRKAPSAADKGGGWSAVGMLRSLRDSFVRTFVTEERWRLMARGLGVTLVITFASFVLGSFLAFPVWLMRTSRNRVLSSVAKGWVTCIQGVPVLVMLMVLFYIVFGEVDVDAILVAIIGFALNESTYVGEILRGGVESVPRGQTEAALALGYGPKRAFLRFVLPQAVRAVLPVYRGEFIALLKATSIVGYIAINDLTKASDLVRSRTYESFFPILTTAFIYFVAAWLMTQAFERIGRWLDPASDGMEGVK